MMTRLYELTSAYAVIAELIEADDGNDWAAALETLTDDIGSKAENIAKLVRSLEAEADAYAAEYNRLKAQGEARVSAARRLKDYLKGNLEACGIDKVRAGLFTVVIQSNPPACRVLDEAAIPEAFKSIVTITKIDNRGIIEAVKGGAEVPGVSIERGTHLRIR